MHWVAHLAAYALIAFACGLGWPRRPSVQIAAFIALIGAIHEITEIATHHHGLELEDIAINAVGVLIGVAIQRVSLRAIFQ